MIDRLQRIAYRIRFLRLPSVALGSLCVASIVVILIFTGPRGGERWLMPSFIGLLWSISAYSFIVAFRSVPSRPDDTLRSIGRIKRRIARGWYWFIGMVFLAASVGVLVASFRLASIWFKDYGG